MARMLLCIPISESDKHLLDGFIACLQKFGPYNNHQLLVVGSPNVSTEIQDTELILRDLFASSSSLVFKKNYTTGWPHACNSYFFNTAAHVEFELKPDPSVPWYYFELDNTPTKQGWLDELQADYIAARLADGTKAFMGVRQQTLVADLSTNQLKSGTGSHMVGTGMYPIYLSKHSLLIKSIWNVPNIPWDVYMQWEIDNPRNSKLTHTDKIQHNWGTANYRQDGAKIVCDSTKDLPLGIAFNEPIRKEAVVVHGCKDGSFAKILLGVAPKFTQPDIVTEVLPQVSDKAEEPAVDNAATEVAVKQTDKVADKPKRRRGRRRKSVAA